MRVVWALGWSAARRRLGALLALAVVVAVGIGVSAAAFEAARRTERAYPAYLERADVGDLVLNANFNSDLAEEVIRTTPGVAAYTSDDLLAATLDDGAPRPQSVVTSPVVQVRMSEDGRYSAHDRPVVHEGRMIRSGQEAFLSREAAEAYDIHLGDEVPLSFWAFLPPSPTRARPDDIVEPVGRSLVRVVGIGVFADEVLVDELYPRQRMLVTPNVARPFTCTYGEPRAGDPRTAGEIFAEVIPPGCALAYRYFSLQLEGGDADVGPVTEALLARFSAENERLPASILEEDSGYFATLAATRAVHAQMERSLQPVVTALRAFALAVGSSTVVVVVLGMARVARRDEDDVRTWRHLGVTRIHRVAAVALPLGAAMVVGLLVAVVVAWLASGIGPVASARDVEPDAALHLSGPAVTVVLGAALAALGVGCAAVAAATARAVPRRPEMGGRWVNRVTGLASAPAQALGIRAALASGRAGAVLAGSVVAVAVVLATVVFSTSLGGLIDHPARYGWPYDAGVVVGFGYGGLDHDALEETLDRAEVSGRALAGLGGVSIEGESVAAVGAGAGFDEIGLPVIDGEFPVGPDEVALGVQTSRALDLGIGDELVVGSDYGEVPARVSGLVVLPPLGPFESDRAEAGTGVLLAEELFDALVGLEEAAAGLRPGEMRSELDAFVGIDLQEGVDPEQFLAEVHDQVRSWDGWGFVPFEHPDPVRPPLIADVAAMQRIPVALGGFFALAMALGLALGIAAATRERRRELAQLRALGCSGRQLAASVRWHALTVVATAIVIGAPLGIAVGRTLYSAFAHDLGVVPSSETSAGWVALVLIATVVIGLLAALRPGRRAAHEASALVLRDRP